MTMRMTIITTIFPMTMIYYYYLSPNRDRSDNNHDPSFTHIPIIYPSYTHHTPTTHHSSHYTKGPQPKPRHWSILRYPVGEIPSIRGTNPPECSLQIQTLGNVPYRYKPSGMFPRFRYKVFSFALMKSSWLTFIRRSRRANKPASVQTAGYNERVCAKGYVQGENREVS